MLTFANKQYIWHTAEDDGSMSSSELFAHKPKCWTNTGFGSDDSCWLCVKFKDHQSCEKSSREDEIWIFYHKRHSNPSNNCRHTSLRPPNINLMVTLEENSGGHQGQQASSSGNHHCQEFVTTCAVDVETHCLTASSLTHNALVNDLLTNQIHQI